MQVIDTENSIFPVEETKTVPSEFFLALQSFAEEMIEKLPEPSRSRVRPRVAKYDRQIEEELLRLKKDVPQQRFESFASHADGRSKCLPIILG